MYDLGTLIATAFGGIVSGCLITVVGFVLPMGNRITHIETSLQDLKDTVKVIPPCSLHLHIEKQVAINTERLDKLEKARDEAERR